MITKYNSWRNSGDVLRLHAVGLVRPQSLAHHQWNVARIHLSVFPDSTDLASLLHCLFHDTSELILGDMPAPAKIAAKEQGFDLGHVEHMTSVEILGEGILRSLSVQASTRLVWCDKQELVEFMHECVLAGDVRKQTRHVYDAAKKLAHDAMSQMTSDDYHAARVYTETMERAHA